MLIKGNQRGHGSELARHLQNANDNEHIEIHAIEGFAGDTIEEAFQEAEIISNGTQCTQYLFSVSLSPPPEAKVSTQQFEEAIGRVSQKLGLEGQPHVIVFHEKNARRHCHVVFSRIDAEQMKAINLPFYKNKLMEVSKDLYLEHGWDLPQGFIDKSKRNPLNFTLQEWQQAKRLGHDPKMIKAVLKQCWARSSDRASFAQRLQEHGFCLAKGDRRGFVAVDWQGKPFSLSRWCDVKSKELKQRLGDPATLPTVKQATAQFDQRLVTRMEQLQQEIMQKHQPQLDSLHRQQAQMKVQHIDTRAKLIAAQQQRQLHEAQQRQQRFSGGLRGFWHKMTGHHSRILQQNQMEHYQSLQRDQRERDGLILSQLGARQNLQISRDNAQNARHSDMMQLREAVFSKMPEHKIEALRPTLNRSPTQGIGRDTGLSL